MGFVHHSNYARFYENARWELFRELGIPNSEIEKLGIFIPVIAMDFKFTKPAFYDDEVTVVTTIKELPSVKMKFHYQLINSDNKIINSATVTCAFIDSKTSKVMRAPKSITETLSRNFNGVLHNLV